MGILRTIGLGLVLLILVLFGWYFFGREFVVSLLDNPQATQTGNFAPIDESKPLTVEEKKEVLDDLLPDNVQLSEKEIEEKEDLLNQLVNPASEQTSTLDLLNQLNNSTSKEEKEDLLRELAQ